MNSDYEVPNLESCQVRPFPQIRMGCDKVMGKKIFISRRRLPIR